MKARILWRVILVGHVITIFFFFFNRLKVGVGGLALSGDMGCDMCIVPELWERVRRRNGGAEGLTT